MIKETGTAATLTAPAARPCRARKPWRGAGRADRSSGAARGRRRRSPGGGAERSGAAGPGRGPGGEAEGATPPGWRAFASSERSPLDSPPPGMPPPGPGPGPGEAASRVREAAGRDPLAADLRCSLFAAALQSYKRDSALRPFPGRYAGGDAKDFEGLLADTHALPSLKELESVPNTEKRTWDLFSWILSSKVFVIQSTKKREYEKIQELTGMSGAAVPAPDYLFEIVYCDQMNTKFAETKGERDLIYAFHGSRLENFHSILHNGLHCHLNRTSLFGEGTYLTSDLSLALLYSPHGLGWQRSVLGSVLSCIAVCEIIDHPDVKCQVKKKDSEEIDRKRARVKNSEGGDVPQKYFVVTNNQLLRVKYLLVYSQKQHRRPSSQSSWFYTHRFAVMMMLYLLLLILIGASNSPTFIYYWHRMFDSER
ncbi:protein mono-ADP-ribosyltransferase PARP16 [Grus americana]|nr:protein mono-ADP-ribosyltransferase PARP16 [Grus americana]